MRIVAITLWGQYDKGGRPVRTPEITRKRFAEQGVEAQLFYGVHAAQLGVETTLPYEVDGGPGCGFRIGPLATGCWLSHRMLWSALLLLPDERFLVLEEDAQFPPDWRERIDQAMKDAGEFDVLLVGSCCTRDKPRKHIAGSVYEVRWPVCSHGYIVRRHALETMIATQDEARCYAPIDISLTFHTYPRMSRVYTVLPRILSQHDTYLPE